MVDKMQKTELRSLNKLIYDSDLTIEELEERLELTLPPGWGLCICNEGPQYAPPPTPL